VSGAGQDHEELGRKANPPGSRNPRLCLTSSGCPKGEGNEGRNGDQLEG